jgi:hypothetical protein
MTLEPLLKIANYGGHHKGVQTPTPYWSPHKVGTLLLTHESSRSSHKKHYSACHINQKVSLKITEEFTAPNDELLFNAQ